MNIKVELTISTTEELKQALDQNLLPDDQEFLLSARELRELLAPNEAPKPYELVPTEIPKPRVRRKAKVRTSKKKPEQKLKYSDLRVCALDGCDNVLTAQQVKNGSRYCSISHATKGSWADPDKHRTRAEAMRLKRAESEYWQTRKPVVIEAGEGVRDNASLA